MTHLEDERLHELWNLLQRTRSSNPLEEWCERCEIQWKTPSSSSSLQPCGEWKASEEDEPSLIEKQQLISNILLRWIECYETETTVVEAEQQSQPSSPEFIELRLLLRISKNFLRSLLQSMYSSTATNSLQEGMMPWRSYRLLRQYLSWMQEYCGSDPVLAQHASQLLFYTSYNPVSGCNEGLIQSYQQLLEEDQIMSQLLDCLVRSLNNDVALALSIVRNVHNILVSFPRGMEYTLTVQPLRMEDCPSEWPEHTPVTFASFLPYLALRALDANPFGNINDKRAELIVEILRAAYVLRLGKQIELDGLFAQLIAKLLRLEVTTPQCEECRREAIPPLMDATAEVLGIFLESQDVLLPLWAILEHQVTQVVEQTLVQDSAAAALTPILVVLYKVATHHASIRQQLRSHIFPDESFQEKKRQEIEQHGQCRNMKPLDAPVGTLRYKLIQLLTWPHSHIKRFAGELLWSLCEGDAQEFIARVGMGNAVAILGALGLVRLPGQASS